MRAILTSFGSTGDFEPFLALAIEFQRHGHRPQLAFLPQYGERAARHGIEFAPTGSPDLFEAVRQSIRMELARGAPGGEQFSCYRPAAIIGLFKDLLRVCDQADVLICSAQWPCGRMVHELTGIPFVSVQLDRFSEKFARESRDYIRAWEEEFATVINPFRWRLGLSPLKRLLTDDGDSSQLALFAVSRLLLEPEREPHWAPHHHVTGFFFVDEPWAPDRELEEFMTSGPPPVVFTFGSMTYDGEAELAEIVIDVVRHLDARVILQHGWGELFHGRDLPDRVKTVDFVPYSWLFPRAGCVVQAGGAGTTAWTLRAGAPTVCIPQLWQQFSYARFAEDIGSGVVIPWKELSVDRLRAAVAEVLSSSNYRSAAQAASAQIRAEGGVRTARRLIERWRRDLPWREQ
ncbi:MAG: glycosyltransferase [Acidobacteria bacterium]|nr:glycosyltransferase [Acidobacteriota bacterium]